MKGVESFALDELCQHSHLSRGTGIRLLLTSPLSVQLAAEQLDQNIRVHPGFNLVRYVQIIL